MSRLDDLSNCPLAQECDNCGGYSTTKCAAQTPAGVLCFSLCRDCAAGRLLPNVEARDAVARSARHAEHLGMTPHEMTALMLREFLEQHRGLR
ncbi:MAG: hypothetical protein ABWY93_18715 [Mycobacterium sp.]